MFPAYQNKGWHTAGFVDYIKKKRFQRVSCSCGNSLRSFFVCFLFFEGSGKAFKTEMTSSELERSPQIYFSEEQMSRSTWNKRKGRGSATAKSWPVKGAFSIQASGADRGPRFTSSVRLSVSQLLFLCRIWSNSLCKRKPNLLHDGCWGSVDKSWMCSVPVQLKRAAPALHSSSDTGTIPFFFCCFAPTLFATTAAWVELSHWMVALLWNICCHEGAFVLWGIKASKTEHNCWQFIIIISCSQL